MKIFVVFLSGLTIATSIAPAGAGSRSSRDVAPAIYAPDDPDPAVTAPEVTTPAPATPPAAAPTPQEPQQTLLVPPAAPRAAEDDAQVPFDFKSFCNSPASDGSPRSPVWTESCMAGAATPGVPPDQTPAR